MAQSYHNACIGLARTVPLHAGPFPVDFAVIDSVVTVEDRLLVLHALVGAHRTVRAEAKRADLWHSGACDARMALGALLASSLSLGILIRAGRARERRSCAQCTVRAKGALLACCPPFIIRRVQRMPKEATKPAINRLKSNSIYLLDDGFRVQIWLGKTSGIDDRPELSELERCPWWRRRQ